MKLVCVASLLSTHTALRVRANIRNRVNVSGLIDYNNEIYERGPGMKILIYIE
jgi:hypothetical protein